jgi:hypothetical protein
VLLLLAITGVQNSGDDRVQALQAMVTGAGAAFARSGFLGNIFRVMWEWEGGMQCHRRLVVGAAVEEEGGDLFSAR